MDRLLEEQIARMKLLNERLAQIHRRVTETTEAVTRVRQLQSRGPLQDVRDYRTLESHEYGFDANGHYAKPAQPQPHPTPVAQPSRKRRRR